MLPTAARGSRRKPPDGKLTNPIWEEGGAPRAEPSTLTGRAQGSEEGEDAEALGLAMGAMFPRGLNVPRVPTRTRTSMTASATASAPMAVG